MKINLYYKYLHFYYENKGKITLLTQNQHERTSEVRDEWEWIKSFLLTIDVRTT